MTGRYLPNVATKALSLLVLASLYLGLATELKAQVYQDDPIPVFVNSQDQNSDKFIDKLEFYTYTDSLITYKLQEVIAPDRPYGYSYVEYSLQTKYVYDLDNNKVTEIVRKEDGLNPSTIISQKTVAITENHKRDLYNTYFYTSYPSRMFTDFDDFNFKKLQVLKYDSSGDAVPLTKNVDDDKTLVALGAEPYYTNEEEYAIKTSSKDYDGDGKPNSVKISYVNSVGLEMCSITRMDGQDNDGFVSYDLISVNTYNQDGVLQETETKLHFLNGVLD